MKLLIFAFAFIFACNSNASKELSAQKLAITKTDTVYIPRTDTIYLKCSDDSLKDVISKLRGDLFLSNYKIERVRYYLKICIRRPGQTKFLVSWVNRAIK